MARGASVLVCRSLARAAVAVMVLRLVTTERSAVMAQVAEPPSGTRDFLAPEVRRRERAFAAVRTAVERYGFDPLQTPAFERLDVLTGKDAREANPSEHNTEGATQ
jgi:hypothetical protein